MGWSGSLNASSGVGSAMTYTPDTTTQGGYTVSAFTAPKKGVYRFTLKGSGGQQLTGSDYFTSSPGGTGGLTTGYLVLEAGQTVYIGAGGTCSAAFVSRINASSLAATGSKENLYFVAGAGGEGGANWGPDWNLHSVAGGNGGGTTGASVGGTTGGTQTSGGTNGYGDRDGKYGTGGASIYGNNLGYSEHGGRGGDGLYGGGGGNAREGGSGGSGYVYSTTLKVGSNTFTSSTAQGGGAGNNSRGSVTVTYYADAELPVTFNGVRLVEIRFNGTKVEHLIYNGAAVFAHMLKRGAASIRTQILALMCKPTELKEAWG